MLGLVLMFWAISGLTVRCRKAGQRPGGPTAILLCTWSMSEMLAQAILYYVGVLPRVASFFAMLVGILGGAIAYISIVRALPKPPKK